MRVYEIEIAEKTYEITANSMHAAINRAMKEFEKLLKNSKERSRVGDFYRMSIERKR